MRLFYTIDLYVNAVFQLAMNYAKCVRIHTVWFRLTMLVVATYCFFTSIVLTLANHDLLGTALACLFASSTVMFIFFNLYEAFLTLVGEHEIVIRARRKMQDRVFRERSVTYRPLYLVGVCGVLMVTPWTSSSALMMLMMGFLFLTLDLYLETCV